MDSEMWPPADRLTQPSNFLRRGSIRFLGRWGGVAYGDFREVCMTDAVEVRRWTPRQVIAVWWTRRSHGVLPENVVIWRRTWQWRPFSLQPPRPLGWEAILVRVSFRYSGKLRLRKISFPLDAGVARFAGSVAQVKACCERAARLEY